MAMRVRADVRAAAAMWRNSAAAWRNGGFRVRRPKRTAGDTAVLWYHAWHRGSYDDRSLDPRHPDALVYADVPGGPLVLVGVMYYMPRGVRGPTPAGPVLRWHWHRDCVKADGRVLKPIANGTCPPDSRSVQSNEMMHVWFTADLRSAFALHAPVRELCLARLLAPRACQHAGHAHD